MGVLPTEEIRLPLLKKDMKRIYRRLYPNHNREQRDAFATRLNSITAIRNALEGFELKVFGASWKNHPLGRLRSQDPKATNKKNPSSGIVKNDVGCRVNRLLRELELKRSVDLLGERVCIPVNANLPYVGCDTSKLDDCVLIDYSVPCPTSVRDGFGRLNPKCEYIDYTPGRRR